MTDATGYIWGDAVAGSLASTCSTKITCAIPGLYFNARSQEFVYTLPLTSSDTCCNVAEVIISYYLDRGTERMPSFLVLKANDILEVSCTGSGVCENSCRYAGDGDCQDGGDGADNTLCAVGTDCADCGVRGQAPDASTFENALSLMCKFRTVPNSWKM
jgi:hypothetical protein